MQIKFKFYLIYFFIIFLIFIILINFITLFYFAIVSNKVYYFYFSQQFSLILQSIILIFHTQYLILKKGFSYFYKLSKLLTFHMIIHIVHSITI